MTYNELIEKLSKMNKDRLNDHVTIYVRDMDEYIEVESIKTANEHCDVLDNGHIYLVI